MNFQKEISSYLNRETKVLQALDTNLINSAINLFLCTLQNGGTIYTFGNGGSASTASHFASDFNKGVSEGLLRKFNFVCLSDNTATIMAVANDLNYDEIFRYQLEGRLKRNDVAIGISGSGNSQNVINAIEYAKSIDVKTIGITGYDGGKLKQICDISLHADIDDMQISEDIHLIFNHMMMQILKEYLNKK